MISIKSESNNFDYLLLDISTYLSSLLILIWSIIFPYWVTWVYPKILHYCKHIFLTNPSSNPTKLQLFRWDTYTQLTEWFVIRNSYCCLICECGILIDHTLIVWSLLILIMLPVGRWYFKPIIELVWHLVPNL